MKTITQIDTEIREYHYDIQYYNSVKVKYNNKYYKCLLSHKSVKSWEPETNSYLWEEIPTPTVVTTIITSELDFLIPLSVSTFLGWFLI